MYRPQFAYATPEGYTDQDFSYSFDFSNTPALNTPSGFVIPGQTFNNVILPLQPDEVFMWRGWKVQTTSFALMSLYIQWRDPNGNYLSPAPVPVAHIALPSGAIGWGRAVVPIEPEIPCPAGSNILVNILNLNTPGFSPPTPRIVMYGVKRGPLMEAAV
jgi:hypothetical protein